MNERVQKYKSAIMDARMAFNEANEGCSSEDIRSMAISMVIEEDRASGNAAPRPQQTPAPQGGLGNCDKCGSSLTVGKAGKKPYCKPCYIQWKDAQGA